MINPTLMYLHGFLSSPQSIKAKQTQAWLAQHRPHWKFVCPELSPHPRLAQQTLDTSMMHHKPGQPLYLLGSSLGGFWATYLSERYNLPAVLINPAVNPHTRFREVVGQPLQHYHHDATYLLQPEDLNELEACSVSQISRPERYWLLVQTGDETLDYRQAVALYQGCRQTVEADGNHAFVGFEHWLPDFADFFEAA